MRKALAFLVSAALSTGAFGQAVKNLKAQGSWPASLPSQDHFRIIASNIEKVTGGAIKIEVMAAGQVVPPFEVLDVRGDDAEMVLDRKARGPASLGFEVLDCLAHF